MGAERTPARAILIANTVMAVGLGMYFLLIPGLLVLRNLRDPALRDGTIPREAWRIHRYLAPRYERWARARIASGKAAEVDYLDVPGTEWPPFGSVFYLRGTEHLQKAWELDNGLSEQPPVEYARGAIEACKDVLMDPVHHSWVRKHWGDDYMHQENVFFRSLIIAGLASYERLVGTGEYLPILRDQLDTLADELDASPFGILHDYPHECYPIDVFAAVAWLREADDVAGTDHTEFVARERRAFEGDQLDHNGLIPWFADPRSGQQIAPSRGIVNAHILVFAHLIYPDLAKTWYEQFERHFWQETWWAAGWREFYRGPGSDWTYDVDSGPIIGGFSPSANAFGVAAARVNGRMDHAYKLVTQVLSACWPLPDGRLLGPRILSDWDHAPYLAETAILWQLTEPQAEGVAIVPAGDAGNAVKIGHLFYFGGFVILVATAALRVHQRRRAGLLESAPFTQVQLACWGLLVVTGLALMIGNRLGTGLIPILFAQLMPVCARRRKP